MTTNTMFCLKGLYPTLTATERRLADYFLANALQLPQTPMLEIARACGTSKPAVVRLCKKLGFSGYKAFLTTLNAEIAISLRDNRPDFMSLTRESSAQDICTAVAYWQIASLEDTVLQVNADHMEQAMRILMSARRIDVCGLGSGAVAAHAASHGLERLGLRVHVSRDPQEQLARAESMQPGDVLAVLSDAAPHPECVAACQAAREHGANVVAILRRRTHEAERLCDVIVQYASADAPEAYCGVATRTAMLCAVDMLIALTISRGNQPHAQPWEQLHAQGTATGK